MPRTTPPRPLDVEAEFPELAAHRGLSTRLHPRPGDPGPTESSVGGPLLWPADEPWPVCRTPHRRDRGRRIEDVHEERRVLARAWLRTTGTGPSDEERETVTALRRRHRVPGLDDTTPLPLLPLAQLFARDVPGLGAPEGSDLLQVLWCPFDAHAGHGPGLRLVWRRAADVGALLTEPPRPPVVGSADYVPEPCVLDPEPVVEHQYQELLGAELCERIEEWEEAAEEAAEDDDEADDEADCVTYHHDLSLAPGWKVGGFASWSVTGPADLVCSCGAPTRLLLTVAGSEWDRGSLSWVPVEDRERIDTYDANVPTRVVVGRGGSLNVFVCTADPTHEHRVSLQ
ncbi:hypothetical protein ACIBBD_32420 [Streptomyces sp. NPDC051315]|uniref:hypothetical protein n=1 Tax=Streptomyces sp. NPDC051315 TaxID=3365650 RepID=UPI0037B4048F